MKNGNVNIAVGGAMITLPTLGLAYIIATIAPSMLHLGYIAIYVAISVISIMEGKNLIRRQ